MPISAIPPKDRLIIALDSKGGKVVVKGWQEATEFTAEEMIPHLEPYCSGFLCTYVDKEGMLQGTDLDWFRRLRAVEQCRHLEPTVAVLAAVAETAGPSMDWSAPAFVPAPALVLTAPSNPICRVGLLAKLSQPRGRRKSSRRAP